MFAGGRVINDSGSEVVDTIDIYNIATGSWKVDRLSEPREGLAAAAWGDFIMFAGGMKQVC